MYKHEKITVLSVSPFAADHDSLAGILGSNSWLVLPAPTLTLAKRFLRSHLIRLVISECELAPHSWRDLLAEIDTLANPPLLIITSRHADDYLWAEALNLGAYDVLAKPFETAEVRRSVSIAVLHSQRSLERTAPPLAKAAGA